PRKGAIDHTTKGSSRRRSSGFRGRRRGLRLSREVTREVLGTPSSIDHRFPAILHAAALPAGLRQLAAPPRAIVALAISLSTIGCLLALVFPARTLFRHSRSPCCDLNRLPASVASSSVLPRRFVDPCRRTTARPSAR